jgi:hypothetical protein
VCTNRWRFAVALHFLSHLTGDPWVFTVPLVLGRPAIMLVYVPYIQADPVTARSKARVCGHTLAGIVGSNLAGGMDVCLL